MTNKEAINEIEKLDDWISKQPSLLEDWCKTSDALYIATQALEAQPCEDCVSREAVIKNIKWWFDKIELNPDILIDSMITLPSVKPQYTDEEIDKMQEIEQAYVDKMIELAIEESRQKVKPSDSVNRAAVKLDMLKYGFSSPNMTVTEFADSLPPVYPERPRGKWIKCKSRFGTEYFKCSECGRKLNWIDSDDNYCNSCGSDNSESTKELYKAKLAEIIGGEKDAD